MNLTLCLLGGMALSACESKGCGDIGDRCDQICAEGETATCVTDSICACVLGDQSAGTSMGGNGGGGDATSGEMSGGIGGAQGPRECDPLRSMI